jgi:glycosyltransferase involved in cell wall biosynthesis
VIATTKLSLICPTIGRDSLRQTIYSAVTQMLDQDEMIVVGDGPQPKAREIAARFPRVTYLELPVKIGDFGSTPCDLGIERATGDAVFFIGDDDICAEGAFDAIRAAFSSESDRPHAFGRKHGGRDFKPYLAISNISGQQIVVPRDMEKMPKMADVPMGEWNISDWEFIAKVHKNWGETTVLHNEIIAVLQPGWRLICDEV